MGGSSQSSFNNFKSFLKFDCSYLPSVGKQELHVLSLIDFINLKSHAGTTLLC